MEILTLIQPWLKAAHIISMVAWMAAIFYLPRLFAYHVKTGGINSVSHEVFVVMERRLLQIIATPAMLLTWLFGLALVHGVVDWTAVWPWVKFIGIIVMTWFHFWLAGRRKLLMAGNCPTSERAFRIMNELPTVLMIIIVLMVVVKPF